MNPAPGLPELQHWLNWIITDPRGVREALNAPHPNGEKYRDRYTGPSESQLAWIEDERASVISRLDVYAEGYFLRILESLGKDFPNTNLATGAKLFSIIVSQYLKTYPSRFSSIDEVGYRLAHFIAEQDELPYAWIPDLALLEWSQIEAFYAHEPDFVPDWYTNIDSTFTRELRFRVHPSVRLLKSKFSLPNILEALEGNTEFKNQANFLEPSFLIIYRYEDLHCWDEVTAPMFEVLQKIKSGRNLDEATSHLEDEDANQLSVSFSRWVQKEILISALERPVQ